VALLALRRYLRWLGRGLAFIWFPLPSSFSLLLVHRCRDDGAAAVGLDRCGQQYVQKDGSSVRVL
jgi:hypothetical protein